MPLCLFFLVVLLFPSIWSHVRSVSEVWFNTRLTEMGINYCCWFWLSAQPSLPAKHIAFLIAHCFSFVFLWFYPATHCTLPDFIRGCPGQHLHGVQVLEGLLGCASEQPWLAQQAQGQPVPGATDVLWSQRAGSVLVICSDFVACCWEWISWWRYCCLARLQWERGTRVWCCTNCSVWDVARKK